MVSGQSDLRDRERPSPDEATSDHQESPPAHQGETTLERSLSLFLFFFSILLRLFSPLLRVAIELRNWLLFFAPVVLEGFLPADYYENLMALVEVLHLLLSRNISVKALDNAEYNLEIFLKSFESLYGCDPS